MPSSIRDEPNLRGCPEFGGKYRARELNKMIYTITQKKSFSEDFTMIDQLRRASISIASNFAFCISLKVLFQRFNANYICLWILAILTKMNLKLYMILLLNVKK